MKNLTFFFCSLEILVKRITSEKKLLMDLSEVDFEVNTQRKQKINVFEMQQITKFYIHLKYLIIFICIYGKCTENQDKSLIKYTRRRLPNNTSFDIYNDEYVWQRMRHIIASFGMI